MKLHVGTSGYSYKEWKGSFYPADLKAADMLHFYAQRLSAVELNNTFYRMPRQSVVEGWAEQVPETFRFSVKASQRITHMKRLKQAEEETAYLLNTLEALGPRLGILLFQLPPNFKANLDVLDAFLQTLPPNTPAAFEFRHDTWQTPEVRQRLEASRITLCLADVDDAPEPELIPTAERGYLRLRREAYDTSALTRWVERVREQPWKEAYIFFKHEDEAAGPALAAEFLRIWNA